MNIFWLDTDLRKNAEYYCDKHVVKMITEYAQMLSTANRLNGLDEGYKITHLNHPCNIWVRESLYNWKLLRLMAYHINEEYYYRFMRPHKSFEVIKSLHIPPIKDIGLTTPPLCMPDKYKTENIINSYRNYYLGDKKDIAKWNHSKKPDWFV